MGATFREPAKCVIELDRQPLPGELSRAVCEITVLMSRRQAAKGALVFKSFRDESGNWSIQDAGVIEPWKPVVITAIFGSRREEVFRGFIKNVVMEYPDDMGEVSVTAELQDQTLALDREHIRRVWTNTDRRISDGQIVRDLVKKTFDRVDVDQGLVHTSLCQDATAAVFIRERAEAIGYELYARSGTLYFKKPILDEEPQPAIRVYAGSLSNCSRLTVSHDGHLPDQVRLDHAVGVGHENKSSVFTPKLSLLGSRPATSRIGGFSPYVWRLNRPQGDSPAQMEASAQAKADQNAWKISAEGVLDGGRYGHVLVTHKTVEVDGVGPTYAGRYYVDEVTHRFGPLGYEQNFRLLRNATG